MCTIQFPNNPFWRYEATKEFGVSNGSTLPALLLFGNIKQLYFHFRQIRTVILYEM